MKYEDEYILGDDGRYRFNGSHSEDFMKYAPATICQVMHRIDNIRKILKTESINVRQIEHEVRAIPFEEEFKSGDAIRVKNALVEFSRNNI
jgi:hypothetical protein